MGGGGSQTDGAMRRGSVGDMMFGEITPALRGGGPAPKSGLSAPCAECPNCGKVSPIIGGRGVEGVDLVLKG